MAAFWYKFFSFIKLRWLFNITLVGMLTFTCYALGFLLAALIDVYYLKDEIVIPEYVQVLPEAKTTKEPITEYRDLMLSNLFDTLPGPTDFLEENVEAKDSNLDGIELMGTLIWEDTSLAILVKDNLTNVVRKNEKIPDSEISLAEVESKRVLIKAGVNERWLNLDNFAKTSGTPSTARTQSRPANNQQSKTTNNQLPQASGGVRAGKIDNGRQEVFVTKERAEHELKNFSLLLSQARVYPNFTESGASNGFIIEQITPNSIFDQIGLKNGDIIKTINGADINSPEKAFELVRLLRNEKLIQVNVSRKSSPLELTYHIN